jgi:B12 binding domain
MRDTASARWRRSTTPSSSAWRSSPRRGRRVAWTRSLRPSAAWTAPRRSDCSPSSSRPWDPCASPGTLREIGDRWAGDRLGIASEHLGTGVLRSLLGSALVPTATVLQGPRVVFSTLTGERHELGLQMAALTAMGAGANPIYLGADLPVEDMLGAVECSRAAALALSVVSTPDARAARTVGALRGGLPAQVHLWVGGASARGMDLPDGAECIRDLDDLEQRVALLVADGGSPSIVR